MLISKLQKEYNNFNLKIDDLEIKDNEITAIVGNSGGGKSTLIRCIAGLEKYSGEILYKNQNINDEIFAYMNQKRILFNHLTIRENLALTNIEIEQGNELLKKLNLNFSILDQYPFQISGGQAQRIDFLRTIMSNKKILLLDEPFSALDSKTRDDIYLLIEELKKEYNLTIVLVTHDLMEAALVANKIIVLQKGSVLFSGQISDFILKENNIDFVSQKKINILRRIYE